MGEKLSLALQLPTYQTRSQCSVFVEERWHPTSCPVLREVNPAAQSQIITAKTICSPGAVL